MRNKKISNFFFNIVLPDYFGTLSQTSLLFPIARLPDQLIDECIVHFTACLLPPSTPHIIPPTTYPLITITGFSLATLRAMPAPLTVFTTASTSL